ncbi:MAG: L-seryl-tRNA(Sec) selenium transferase [Deltaproteobacteria bacterium HGW-Deltaproteobacteria-19]|jgi:L-seryl-tRNA(Ser) seleniumtransferase|nr:MAG: L-seryl-tRNA(Sec) selenium transferase [Deltaproteobacteria bacterium HGW-Deltaproteobacteria-19]
MEERTKSRLRKLPKIDELMLLLEKRDLVRQMPREFVREACRTAVDDLRRRILAADAEEAFSVPDLRTVADGVEERLADLRSPRLKRVVNATGVILHTNLGRAPLSREAVRRVAEVAGGYSNLEFDLEKGERGLRYDHVRDLLLVLTGAEEALVVNNNAAAVLLVLNTLAEGREAIVSRGELVEIGGEFRIPEVMEKSGVRLREVGSTNRTRLGDYERAVTEQTGMILKVHTSNFRILGFTEEVGISDLVALGGRAGIPVMHDLGSGCLIDLTPYGLEHEPTVREVVASGADVVTFSGDKLLGGPQAGIILGRRESLEQIRRNPLNRALRIDKLTLAALEATLAAYLEPDRALQEIRVLKSLTETLDAVRKRARRLMTLVRRSGLEGITLVLRSGVAMAGGGSLPARDIPTWLVGVKMAGLSPSSLGERLRRLPLPVVVRIADEEVLFDVRTLDESDLHAVRDALRTVSAT